MALRATLGADFSEFRQALSNVEVQLKTTADHAKNAGRDLARMAESFSGSKIARDAELAAEAVSRIGGASKLTESEQRKVNAVVTEALAKYKALGQEAPAHLQKLADEIRQVGVATHELSPPLTGWAGAVSKLGPLMAATFSVGAVVAFGKELLATADQVQKLADRTGLTTDEVQRLDYVAGQTGVSLEGMVGAVQNLQQRLGSGDQGAVGALRQLGMAQADFQRLNPYDQFTTLAAAVGGIEDPTRRAAVAADVFGKSWKEIMPAIIADVDRLAAAAPVMADATIKSFDATGDAIDRVKKKLKAEAADITATVAKWMLPGPGGIVPLWASIDWDAIQANIDRQVKKSQTSIAQMFSLDARAATPLEGVFEGLGANLGKAATASKKAVDDFEKLTDAIKEIELGGRGGAGAVWEFGRKIDEAGETAATAKAWDDLSKALYDIEVGAKGASVEVWKFGQVIDEAGDTKQAVTDMEKASKEAAEKSAKAWSVAANVLNEVSRAAEMAGHKTTAAMMSIGAAVAQAAPGGPWAMAAAGGMALFAAFSDKLFKTQGRQVNDLRDAYIAAAGGLGELNRKAQAAGVTLDALLKAKTVKDYEAAIASLNTKLERTASLEKELAGYQQQLADRQAMDWQRAEALIVKYGGTLGTLGAQFMAAKEAASWKSVWDDWQTLIDMGADVGGVLVSMQDEIQTLVQSSLKIGTEIPAQFKPLIAELIRTGRLFDESGAAITDLGTLKFGAPLVSEVDKIIAKIDELIAALRGGLTGAFEDLGKIQIPPVRIPYSTIRETDADLPSFARGGWADFGRGSLAVLHGREAVVPLDRPSAIGNALGGGTPIQITVVTQLDGREVARNQVRHLPAQLALAGV